MQFDVPIPDLSALPAWSVLAAWYVAFSAYMRLSGLGRSLVEWGQRGDDHAPAFVSIPFVILLSPLIAAGMLLKWLVVGRTPKETKPNEERPVAAFTTTGDKHIGFHLDKLNEHTEKLRALQTQQADHAGYLAKVENAARNLSAAQSATDWLIKVMNEQLIHLAKRVDGESIRTTDCMTSVGSKLDGLSADSVDTRKILARCQQLIDKQGDALPQLTERLKKLEDKVLLPHEQAKAYWRVEEGIAPKVVAPDKSITSDGRVWWRWKDKQPAVGERFHWAGCDTKPARMNAYDQPHERISETRYQHVFSKAPGTIDSFLDNWWWTSLAGPETKAEAKAESKPEAKPTPTKVDGWVQYKDEKPLPGSMIEWAGPLPTTGQPDLRYLMRYQVDPEGGKLIAAAGGMAYTPLSDWDTCWWRQIEPASVGDWVKTAERRPNVGRYVQIWNLGTTPDKDRGFADNVYRVVANRSGSAQDICFADTSSVWWRYVPEPKPAETADAAPKPERPQRKYTKPLPEGWKDVFDEKPPIGVPILCWHDDGTKPDGWSATYQGEDSDKYPYALMSSLGNSFMFWKLKS